MKRDTHGIRAKEFWRFCRPLSLYIFLHAPIDDACMQSASANAMKLLSRNKRDVLGNDAKFFGPLWWQSHSLRTVCITIVYRVEVNSKASESSLTLHMRSKHKPSVPWGEESHAVVDGFRQIPSNKFN